RKIVGKIFFKKFQEDRWEDFDRKLRQDRQWELEQMMEEARYEEEYSSSFEEHCENESGNQAEMMEQALDEKEYRHSSIEYDHFQRSFAECLVKQSEKYEAEHLEKESENDEAEVVFSM
ncbi:hypothetical protein L195_g050856, partial [Trifolium pratense]